MNRTKEELVKHAVERGYTDKAIAKISGFLIGVGLKDESELLLWKKGNGTWEEFHAWYNGRDTEKSILETLLEDVYANLDKADNERLRKRYDAQIKWLCANHIKVDDRRKKRE